MRIIVFGANGQLGSDIVDALQKDHEVIPMTHDLLDLSDLQKLEAFLLAEKAEVIINTAAYHHVELCEQNPEKATLLNTHAPALMAKIAKQLHCRFIHFSTDYVFDGDANQPYTEEDIAKPLNVYGLSKRNGEVEILTQNPASLILRVSGLYGTHPCRAKNGLNFVQLMLKLAKEKGEVKVVDDEFVSPTNTKNIAEQVAYVLDKNISGIVHATSEGQCSWYQFADAIFKFTNTQVILHRASSNDFPAKVPRPKYSVLENNKLKQAGLNKMMPWENALKNYLETVGL